MRQIVDTIQNTDRLSPECVMCALNKYINRYPEKALRTKQVEYMQKVFTLFAQAPQFTAIPVIVRDIEELRYDMFGEKDEYAQIKWHFNELLLDQIHVFRQMIKEAEDPLKLAMQLALIGNYIDFGALSHVDEDYLKGLLAQAQSKELDMQTYDRFTENLKDCKKLVYLTDNCGEVVLDRLFIEQILALYPDLKISVLVKGGEAINDATMEDAIQIGLDKLVNVVGNGSNVGGTWFPELSEEALDLVEDADMIFSKGQANFETVRHCGRNVYYLFLCKCHYFAGKFDVEPLTGIFMHEDDPKNR